MDLEIYSIWYQPFWKSGWFIALVILTIFLCGFLVWRSLKKTAVVEEDILSYSQLISAIKIPENHNLASKKEFYSRLTSILKKALDVESKTESEALNLAEEKFKGARQCLEPIFKNAVYIKFSNEDIYSQMKQDKDLAIELTEKIKNASI